MSLSSILSHFPGAFRSIEEGTLSPRRLWHTDVVTSEERSSWINSRFFIPGMVGAILVYLVIVFMPMTAAMFPEEKVVSCTFTGVSDGGRRTISQFLTDCGDFQKTASVPCTTDPSKEVDFRGSYTYDLVVRGPRIPVLMSPTIMSASVSDAQRFPVSADPKPEFLGEVEELYDQTMAALEEAAGPEALEKLDLERAEAARAELDELLSPDRLRAYDYEQPPFDPKCDMTQYVMTVDGLQSSWPARAEELLRVPEGVTPRDPKLPCEGYQCGG